MLQHSSIAVERTSLTDACCMNSNNLAFTQRCGMNGQILVEPVVNVPCHPLCLCEKGVLLMHSVNSPGAAWWSSKLCVNMASPGSLPFLKFKFDNRGTLWFSVLYANGGNVCLHGTLLYPATVSVFLMDVLGGWADGRILVAYFSSVDIPFGTSLVKLFGCRGWQRCIFFNTNHHAKV